MIGDMQKHTQDFVRKNDLNENIPRRVLSLSRAVREVAKEVRKGMVYGNPGFVTTPKFEGQLGDVLFELLCVANAADIDLTEVVHRTIMKMRRLS